MKFFLSDRRNIAEDTLAFWFHPEKPVRFLAGQFGDFTLTKPRYTDAKRNTRAFSFASPPERDDIMIATRMRDSAFKRSLAELPIGAAVEFDGPMGGFTLRKDPARPAIFLVGGIGITPVRSIVEQVIRQKARRQISVFYSNTTHARMAFLDDFENWRADNPNLNFVPTLTDESPGAWPFETGLRGQQMLSRHVADLHAPVYYTVGPPAMVAAMKKMLDEIGVDELHIKSEDFAGY